MSLKYSLYSLLFIILLVIIYLVARPAIDGSTQNAAQSVSLYSQQANIICSKLHLAEKQYNSGNAKAASAAVENTYWNVYDNILEIKYRSYASPAVIFGVENSFHSLSALMLQDKAANQASVTSSVASLCAEVQKESRILNKNA